MSSLKGNPHVFEGPQIAPSETINLNFVAEEGISAETVMLSELTRNTEATLAAAYEQRTVALVQWAVHLAQTGRADGVLEKQIHERLGLG